ncbi:MAG TPA: tyrosine-type recombinase/integrase [Candidatus Melainabacteria bacterium]|nr:tyrosine-type recombinase/integrase [Candidatus Melainabacteria bacterium]
MSLELFFKDIKTMSRIRSGLFGQHLDIYARRLKEQGYNSYVAGLHIHYVEEFSNWLILKQITIQEISREHVARFVNQRRRRLKSNGCDASAPIHFVKFLRELGVIPVEKLKKPSEIEQIIDGFERYLLKERALSPATAMNYCGFATDFLVERFGKGSVRFNRLRGNDVVQFVRCRASKYGKRVKLMGTALRSFLSYLQYRGFIDNNLAFAVPRVAQVSNLALPKALSHAEIDQLIAHCSGSTPLQLRDRAMFLLLARLGLRASEVVSLTLDDIDWQNGSIIVRGKGRRWARMPLPVEVGEAIARYLSDGRPTSKLRTVFLRGKAPVEGLTVVGLSTRVRLAITMLGIEAPNGSAHLFRHSLATNMLRNGSSLQEIGELLRHRSTQTTEVYAKVDINSLCQLALPWPGGVR